MLVALKGSSGCVLFLVVVAGAIIVVDDRGNGSW